MKDQALDPCFTEHRVAVLTAYVNGILLGINMFAAPDEIDDMWFGITIQNVVFDINIWQDEPDDEDDEPSVQACAYLVEYGFTNTSISCPLNIHPISGQS
jgi:hypothetical protein